MQNYYNDVQIGNLIYDAKLICQYRTGYLITA